MKTLFVDENPDCLLNIDNSFVLSDINNISFDLINLLHLSEIDTNNTNSIIYEDDIYSTKSAKFLALSLSSQGRSVYVIPKHKDCKTEMYNLSKQNIYSIVIDGKLYVNEEDGPPQC